MGIKTWFLGVTMMFSPSAHSAEAHTDDLPKVKENMEAMMNGTLDNAVQTLDEMDIQEYKKTVSQLKKTALPKEQTTTFYYETMAGSVLGGYRSATDEIVLNERFQQDRQEMLPYTVQHEEQHDIFNNKTVTLPDGRTFSLLEVPMGLQQHYQLEQVNEIQANIAEILLVRKNYQEGQKKIAASRNNVLNVIAQNPSNVGDELKLAFNAKDSVLSKQGDKYVVSAEGKVVMTLDLTKNSELQKVVDAYIGAKDAFDKEMNKLKKESSYSWYFRAIEKGEINPLDNHPVSVAQEMRFIGSMTASNWMKNYSSEYDEQCLGGVRSFLGNTKDDLTDARTNDANFQAAVREGLNIGGFDFSKEVLQCLNEGNSNNASIKKLEAVQAQIDGNKSYKDIVQTAVNQGLNLENDVERFVSRELLTTGKAKFVWNAEAATFGKKLLAKRDKTSETVIELIENKQVGDTLTFDEMKAWEKEACKRSEGKAFGWKTVVDAKTEQTYVAEISGVREDYFDKDGFEVMKLYEALITPVAEDVADIKKATASYYNITKDKNKITMENSDLQGIKNRMVTNVPTEEYCFIAKAEASREDNVDIIDTTKPFLREEYNAKFAFEISSKIKQMAERSASKTEAASTVRPTQETKAPVATTAMSHLIAQNRTH